jgi:hypothetical protein
VKALSIRQPWAWLIIHGGKDIENRSWKTNYRGRFLVHAGKNFDSDAYHTLLEKGVKLPGISELARGAIIGSVELVDCIPVEDKNRWMSPWWLETKYGFRLQDPKFIVPLPYASQLNFFEVPDEVLK